MGTLDLLPVPLSPERASRRFFAAAALIWTMSPAVARAQTGPEAGALPVDLRVHGPPGCSSTADFTRRLRGYGVRVRAVREGEGARAFLVDLHEEAPGMVGTLAVRDAIGEGRRTVRGADCDAVAAGLAFIAAVILDPERVRSGPPPELQPLPSHPPRPAPDDHEPRWRLALGAGLQAAAGLAPGIEAVPRAFVDVELGRALRWANARLSAGRGFAHQVFTESGIAEITLTDVRLEPCADVATLGAWRGRVCGLVDVVSLFGKGIATVNASDRLRWSLDLGVALRPTWSATRWLSLGLGLGVEFPLTRYRFTFAPNTSAYPTEMMAGFAELTTAVYFW